MTTSRSWLALLALGGACNLHFTTQRGGTRRADSAADPVAGSAPAREVAPPSAAKYDACIARFDAHYEAWLPTIRTAKAALDRTEGQSVYVWMPALLDSYEQVDAKAAVRQTGSQPVGAALASVTRFELGLAFVERAAAVHAWACVDHQYTVDADEVHPPLTGDRDADRIALCGGAGPQAQAQWMQARRAIADRYNKATAAGKGDHTMGEIYGRLRSFTRTAKETTVSLIELGNNRRCVGNGRFGPASDGSWGPLCDWEELPAIEVGKPHVFHLAPGDLPPFAIKAGDTVSLMFELDPAAPAGEDKVPKAGGRWWFSSVTRGEHRLFSECATKHAKEVQIHATNNPLMVMSR